MLWLFCSYYFSCWSCIQQQQSFGWFLLVLLLFSFERKEEVYWDMVIFCFFCWKARRIGVEPKKALAFHQDRFFLFKISAFSLSLSQCVYLCMYIFMWIVWMCYYYAAHINTEDLSLSTPTATENGLLVKIKSQKIIYITFSPILYQCIYVLGSEGCDTTIWLHNLK